MDSFSGFQMQVNQMQMQLAERHRYQAASEQMVRQQGVRLENPSSTQTNQAGTLYIHDHFAPRDTFSASTPTANPHGIQVARTARRQGLQNPIVGTEAVNSPRQTAAKGFLNLLSQGPSAPEQTKSDIREYAENASAGLLDNQSSRLEGLTQRGVRNSAINFSSGESRASTTSELYNAAAGSWNPKVKDEKRLAAEGVLNNYVEAFKLDKAKLTSSDPRISSPERLRLQQHLAKIVDATYNTSPMLAESRRRYDTAVDRFEAGRNSVVVSAGNEFGYLDNMAADAGGQRIRVGENFTHNVLENDAVTSVGATRWYKNGNDLKEVRAGYSSRGNGVDIYASGSLGAQNHQQASALGTSISAPRVAATMAELHRRYPQLSSSQVENMMKNQLTRSMSDSHGQMQVLDHQRTADFLAGAKF